MRALPETHQHPLAGTRMTGAEMIIQVLAEQGVDTIFGYSGGAILPTYDAIFRYNAEQESKGSNIIRLIVPANEQGAGFMAAGYARARGKAGVFLVTSGPGATNGVTPIRDCMADSIPVVMICGQVPRHSIGSDAFQEAPVFNIMSPCAKHVFLVEDPEELEATVRTAFEIAQSGRPGPVVIDVPKDVQNWEGTFRGQGHLHFRGYQARLEQLETSRMSEEKAAAFYELLRRSERPLIYAGGGVIRSDATEQLTAFATTLQVPVVTTLMGIGAMDTAHDLNLHMLGMHGTAYANYAVEDCDFLIAIGARFDDRVAGKVKEFAPHAKVVAHMDIDAAEIGKVKTANWSFVGDAKSGLADLLQMRKNFRKDFSKWVNHVRQLKKRHPLDYDRESEKIQPHYVIECLNVITRGEAVISTGVGQHQMWAAQYYRAHGPRRWITSGGLGTMGFGLPAAMGAQVACPDRLVIDIDGDGSFQMTMQDLVTCVQYRLPVKVFIINNRYLGMVRQWQELFYGGKYSQVDLEVQPDFVKLAEAFGATGLRARRPDEVRPVIEKAISTPGPVVTDLVTAREENCFPIVPAGCGLKEIIDQGEPIPDRLFQGWR